MRERCNWFRPSGKLIFKLVHNDPQGRHKIWKRTGHEEELCPDCAKRAIGNSSVSSVTGTWVYAPCRRVEASCSRCGCRITPAPGYRLELEAERRLARRRALANKAAPGARRAGESLSAYRRRLVEAGIVRVEYEILTDDG